MILIKTLYQQIPNNTNNLGREFIEIKQHWSKPEVISYVYRGDIDMIENIWRELKEK